MNGQPPRVAVARGRRQECIVSGDGRPAWCLIIDVPGVPDRHGYHSAGKQHTGQAAGLIADLAHVVTVVAGYELAADITAGPARQAPGAAGGGA